jgi:hypothetical protein
MDIVATPDPLINLFPLMLLAETTEWLLLALPPAFVGIYLARYWVTLRRRWAIEALGAERGLTESTADTLGRLFQGKGVAAAEMMLSAPELLRARLARELRRRRRDEDTQEFAARAAKLLQELKLVKPPFAGAPQPFHKLLLSDMADPAASDVEAWVLGVDERNLTIVCRSECPWPMRHELMVKPAADQGEPFRAALLLRPVPPRHEWVLAHDLVDVITNRRSAVRVPCEIATSLLPDTGDTILLRERLAEDRKVTVEEVQRRRMWAQRRSGVVRDISPDGCRLELSHEVALRDRFHVVLARLDGELVALPLCEVVDIQRGTAGDVVAGVRYIGLRLQERTRLANFVRELASVTAT